MNRFLLLLLLACASVHAYGAKLNVSRPQGISLEISTSPDYVRVQVPTELLERRAYAEVSKAVRQFKHPVVRSMLLQGFSFGRGDTTHEIAIQIAVHVQHILGKSDCTVRIRMLLPLMSLANPRAVIAGSKANCDVGGDIAMLTDLSAKLSQSISDGIRNTNTSLPAVEMFKEPALAPLGSMVLANGDICLDSAGRDNLCLRLVWPTGVLDSALNAIASLAPAGHQPVDAAALAPLLTKLEEIAPYKDSVRYPGFRYPAKRSGHDYDDGDMSIFGGLLCSVGVEVACELVRRAQRESTGQFWRSPDNIGNWSYENQFSGDQFTGVINYLLRKGDTAALSRYLEFLSLQRHYLPDPVLRFGIASKSCLQDREFTCVLQGEEWFWLNFLANRHGLTQLVPADERDPAKKYGHSWDLLPYRAAFAEANYELHLVGVQIWTLQKAGITSPAIRQAAAIMASRQPLNPFYLLLHLGKDQRVANVVSQKCTTNLSNNEDEWAWERNESKQAWKNSMRWDCIFVIRALQ
ncbi:hypothetical protein ACFQUU_26635 [Herbaspirillum sp. GCM10030257]|uniref:hypothetical protein n=1 Tax=Herbaspirillum sp. GCM10030257 TaxID=3273393 RepID=UPI0036232827